MAVIFKEIEETKDYRRLEQLFQSFDQKLSISVDIYAFGLILLFIIIGNLALDRFFINRSFF